MFEKYYPPSFFDIMLHLTLHLGRKALIGGPIQFRWMYPFERFLKILKGFVKNLARPEATDGRPILAGRLKVMDCDMLEIAHRCVLLNKAEVQPYIAMHREELKHSDRRLLNNESLLERKHISTFSEWLERKVKFGNTSGMSSIVKWLACKPSRDVMSYSGYIFNGNRFHTRYVDRSTQDSGVSLETDTLCRSSAKDTSQAIKLLIMGL
ncbi:hypothetical protein TB1_003783 [Malus domestica]